MEIRTERNIRTTAEFKEQIKAKAGPLRHRDPGTGEVLWTEPTNSEFKTRGRSLLYNLGNIMVEPITSDQILQESEYFEI